MQLPLFPLAVVLVLINYQHVQATEPPLVKTTGRIKLRHSMRAQITNGLNASDAQFPYQVFIKRYAIALHHESYCGGSVIAPRWVLTAAHCCFPKSIKTIYSLGMGSVNKTDSRVLINSTRCIQHPAYDSEKLHNDIALIRADDPIPFNSKYIRPINLPRKAQENSTFAGAHVVVSGFGHTDSEENIPETLKFGVLRVITNKDCDEHYDEGLIISSTICAVSFSRNNQSTCNGDSGGPVVYMVNDKFIQIGIVSFGSDVGCNEAPSVSLRITSYLSWISNVTGISLQ